MCWMHATYRSYGPHGWSIDKIIILRHRSSCTCNSKRCDRVPEAHEEEYTMILREDSGSDYGSDDGHGWRERQEPRDGWEHGCGPAVIKSGNVTSHVELCTSFVTSSSLPIADNIDRRLDKCIYFYFLCDFVVIFKSVLLFRRHFYGYGIRYCRFNIFLNALNSELIYLQRNQILEGWPVFKTCCMPPHEPVWRSIYFSYFL